MDQGLALVVLVLDRSGSMATIRQDMEGAISELLKDQKSAPGRVIVSIYQFDDDVETVAEMRPIDELDHIVLRPRGNTALFDATAFAIDRTGVLLSNMDESSRPGKVIVAMVTDGMENASRRFGRLAVLERITRQRETYHWEFIYLGANQNAIAVGESMGIRAKFCMTYAATAAGVRRMGPAMSMVLNKLNAPGLAEQMKDASGFATPDHDDPAHQASLSGSDPSEVAGEKPQARTAKLNPSGRE